MDCTTRTAECVPYIPEENHHEAFALRTVAAVLAMFSMGTLTACNTMAGAGKDVQKVGEKVEEKAEDCKDAMLMPDEEGISGVPGVAPRQGRQ